MDCFRNNYFYFGVPTLLVLYVVAKYLKQRSDKKKWEYWSVKSQNKVIIHGMYGNSKVVPSVSPFVLKLETYLRMAKIPFEIDKTTAWGPKGKTPWLSVHGENIGDSQLCIQYLQKKFEIDFNKPYTNYEQAIGTTVRIMLEEHLYWGGVLWRFQYGGRETLQKVFAGETSFLNWFIFKMIAGQLKDMAWKQGFGRHSEQDVLQLVLKDIRAVSHILGNKQYLLGSQPCEEDAAVFGAMAGAILATDSPFHQLYEDELKNLKDYTLRMKTEFWPDWDKYLDH